MLSPDEKLKDLLKQKKEIEECTQRYAYKFITSKYRNLNLYGFFIEEIGIGNYVTLYLEKKQYFYDCTRQIVLNKNNVNEISSYLSIRYLRYHILKHDGELESVEKIIKDSRCKQEYEPAIRYFSDVENIKNCIEYATWVHNLVYRTPYIYTLPKAYAFLLCNSYSRTFPKDITKLIVHKLLFFIKK